MSATPSAAYPLRVYRFAHQTPTADQPGTLDQQLEAIGAYVLGVPTEYRRRWPKTAWQRAREAVMGHARQERRDDLDTLIRCSYSSSAHMPASERLRRQREAQR